MPGYMGGHVVLAATNAQLGRREAASRHLDGLLKLSPRYGKFARKDISRWLVPTEMVEHMLEGLAKAGLEID